MWQHRTNPARQESVRRRQVSLSVDGPQLYSLKFAHRQNQQCHVTSRSCASHVRHLCTPFRALASDALVNSGLRPSYRCSTLSSGRQIFCRAGGGFRSRCDVTVSSTGRTNFFLPHSLVCIVLVVNTFLKIRSGHSYWRHLHCSFP